MKKKRRKDLSGIIVKVCFAAFLAVYLGILCMQGYAKDVSVEGIRKEFESEKLLDGIEEMKDKDLRRYYGIESKDCEGYFYYKAESPMAVDELLVLKTKNAQDAGRFEEAVNNRLDSQIESFEGYGVTQTAQLEKAYAQSEGIYVIYMAGDQADDWKSAFESAIK